MAVDVITGSPSSAPVARSRREREVHRSQSEDREDVRREHDERVRRFGAATRKNPVRVDELTATVAR
jgi:hypothetical protein